MFRDSITRVYYAYNDSKTPFIIAASSIILKAILNWLLIIKLNMGIAGITLSTSCITLFNATFLGIFIYKKIKLDYKNLFINFGKMLLAGLLTFIAGWFMCGLFSADTQMMKAVKIVAVIIATSGIYTILNIIFKMDYAAELLKRLKR